MKTYISYKLNSGKWAVMEKRTNIIVAKFDTRKEAIKEIKRQKEIDKKISNERKVSGAILKGYTRKGKEVTLIGNSSLELRSRKCYTLYIENECIFTRGTIQAAMEYMINN